MHAYLSNDELWFKVESPDIHRDNDEEHNINTNYHCDNDEQNPVLHRLCLGKKVCACVHNNL